MSHIFLIRHGKPAAGWGDDDDPGLDETGHAQARAAAAALMALPAERRPTKVVSSPLRRCRETAQPMAEALGVEIEIVRDVGEIPTPRALTLESRGPWLREAFGGTWAQIVGDLDYDAWRRQVATAVAAHPRTAVFSHFVAINAVLSVLAGDDRVIGFRPDHCSISHLTLDSGELTLAERGAEAATGVL
jgi:broad specificity phosphatase PhoE